MLQNFVSVTTPSLEIFFKYFLIFFLLSDTHLFHCILDFFSFSLVEFLQKLIPNLYLVHIFFLRFLFIKVA